jgi:site-specific DNA recombinase
MQSNEPYIPPFLRRRLKGATEESLLEATDSLRRLLKVVLVIYRKTEAKKTRSDSPEIDCDDRFRAGAFRAAPRMNTYFAYIRVSTAKQGQQGSSLQEQRAAIEAFAERQSLTISEWFEDRETAAKKGRVQFLRMMGRLEKRKAAGVLLHKIDRGARNLWDWARIQGLLDAGIEVHLVHDNLDMTSRGGRLAADIQAVVAADYVRNLRDEVHKGLRGRLRQGLLPFRAPRGYLDHGKAQVKTIDPITGPLIRIAFELYHSRQYSYDALRVELCRLGLTRKDGQPVSKNSLTAILRNPFYTGVIRVKSTGESYAGIHEPLITVRLFQEVQDILDGKARKDVTKRDHLYRRLFSCGACGTTLIAEGRKGFVYYRCQKQDCSTTAVREDAISGQLSSVLESLRFSDQDIDEMRPLIDEEEKASETNRAERLKLATLRVSALEEREGRLTDAYIDKLIEREAYQSRKTILLLELAEARHAQKKTAADVAGVGGRINAYLAFMKALIFRDPRDYLTEFREVIRIVTSDRKLIAKKPYITLQWPYSAIASDLAVLQCGPNRDTPRTFAHHQQVVRILKEHLKDWEPPAGVLLEQPNAKKRPSPTWQPNSNTQSGRDGLIDDPPPLGAHRQWT